VVQLFVLSRLNYVLVLALGQLPTIRVAATFWMKTWIPIMLATFGAAPPTSSADLRGERGFRVMGAATLSEGLNEVRPGTRHALEFGSARGSQHGALIRHHGVDEMSWVLR